MYYVHRYFRLTGVYAVVIFFTASLYRFFATGPQSVMVDTEVSACRKNWWSNLLYINNLQFKWDDKLGYPCVAQSWYLANDMQFFLISPIFIFPLWYNQILGLIVVMIGIIVSTVVPTVLTAMNDYPISNSFMGTDFNFFIDF